MFCALQAAQDDKWLQSPEWKQFKKQMANTDVSVKLAQNQRLPDVNLQGRYGVTGVGGLRNQYIVDPDTNLQTLSGTSAVGRRWAGSQSPVQSRLATAGYVPCSTRSPIR